MTDDLVKRLRYGWTEDGICEDFDEDVLLIAADRIEELEIETRFKKLLSEELACYECVEKSKAAADEIEHLKQERDEWIERAFTHQDKCATAAYDEIEHLKQEQKRLGQNSVAYFNRLYANHKDEIERLTKKCDMQAMILRRLTPENYPDVLFIHGTLGDKDQNGMPEKLMVIPAYGVDFSYIYVRTEKTTGPEW